MDEVLINAKTSKLPPAIAGNGGSDFVVIWNDLGGVSLKGQVFGRNGETAVSPFPINTSTDGTHSLPAAAMLAGFSPGFVVAWVADVPGGGNVLFQRFAPDGTRLGAETRVNTTGVDTARPPAIMRLSDLKFVVSWGSSRPDE